jgi:hypothetical protein
MVFETAPRQVVVVCQDLDSSQSFASHPLDPLTPPAFPRIAPPTSFTLDDVTSACTSRTWRCVYCACVRQA